MEGDVEFFFKKKSRIDGGMRLLVRYVVLTHVNNNMSKALLSYFYSINYSKPETFVAATFNTLTASLSP